MQRWWANCALTLGAGRRAQPRYLKTAKHIHALALAVQALCRRTTATVNVRPGPQALSRLPRSRVDPAAIALARSFYVATVFCADVCAPPGAVSKDRHTCTG